MIENTDVLRPVPGDPIVLPGGHELAAVARLGGFTWPSGHAEPTSFLVVDEAGLEYPVVLANRALRIWSVERRTPR